MTTPTIEAWIRSAGSACRVVTEPSPVQLLVRAGRLVSSLPTLSPSAVVAACADEYELPGTLHAVVRILRGDRYQVADSYALLESAYELVQSLEWDDEFEEREGLLAEAAFLVWNCCRRHRTFPETQQWESRVIEHVRAQTPTRYFLALKLCDLSSNVLSRFLSDPAVLLVVWQGIDSETNKSANDAFQSAGAVWSWLTSHRSDVSGDAETIHYLEGRLALTASMAAIHLGRGQEWQSWFGRAKASLRSTKGAEPYLAIAEYNRLGRLHVIRRYSEVNQQIPLLIDRFRTLSMPDSELRAKFLRATNLKDGGGDPAQVAALLTAVYRESVTRKSLLLSALAASGIAQMHAKACKPRLADCYADIGVRLARRSACPWAIAYAVSTWGELLRDRGKYGEAISAYRASVLEYERAQMHPLAAYVRVVTAETLLFAGAEEDAMREVIQALPVIEKEGLIPEAEAAVWLFRQALKQTGMSPAMLRELRERMDSARQKGMR